MSHSVDISVSLDITVIVSGGRVLPMGTEELLGRAQGVWLAGSDAPRGYYGQEHRHTQILPRPRSLHVEGPEGTLSIPRY